MNSLVRYAALLLGALPFAAAPASAKVVLKAGHVTAVDTDQHVGTVAFAKRVAELTKGEVEIQIFPDGQLGKSDPAQLENVISGAQAFFVTGMEWYKAWDDRFGILSTPFVFRDREHLEKFLASDLFADMSKSLDKNGIHFVPKKFNWIRQGDRGILSKKPVFTPADMKGLKLRMFQSEMPIKTWSAFGANLLVLPWADTYTAFATGQVEGVTGAFVFPYTAKHVEFAKYFTNLQEYYQPITPVIGTKTWNQLSAEHKKALEQACEESGEAFVKFSRDSTVDANRDGTTKYGVTFIDVPLKPWQDMMAPVLDDFEKNGVLPKGLVAQVKAIK